MIDWKPLTHAEFESNTLLLLLVEDAQEESEITLGYLMRENEDTPYWDICGDTYGVCQNTMKVIGWDHLRSPAPSPKGVNYADSPDEYPKVCLTKHHYIDSATGETVGLDTALGIQ